VNYFTLAWRLSAARPAPGVRGLHPVGTGTDSAFERWSL